MSKIFDDSMKEYEKLVINDNNDITTPTIDNTSTLYGYTKNKIEKDHNFNFLKGKSIFEGIIFRIPALYQKSNYDFNQLIAARQTSVRDYIYKVRVPEIDGGFLEIPNTYDGTPTDKAIIDLYKDFRAPPDIKFRVGDKVQVTFENLNNYEGGVILNRIPESLADKLVAPATVVVSEQDFSAGASIGFSEAKNILLLGDSHTRGHFGDNLENLFKKNGKSVDRVAHGGITAQLYLNNTPLKGTKGHMGDYDAAKRNTYDLVVVLLSTNDAAGISTAAGANELAQRIKTLLDLLKGKRKLWVSAPIFNNTAATTYQAAFATFDLNKRVELLWRAGTSLLGAGNCVDSRPCTQKVKESTGKDIHYFNKPAAIWAKCVYSKISSLT